MRLRIIIVFSLRLRQGQVFGRLAAHDGKSNNVVAQIIITAVNVLKLWQGR